MVKKALVWLAFACATVSTAAAQVVSVGEKGTVSGTVFSDYYWIAQNHNEELEGNNGFWFRRIYLTYNHQISDAFSGRVRLEMASEGDFISESALGPVVKDAWLKWSNDHHAITAGITSTPTWGLIEDVWGYRSVEKTPLDLYDFGSSRDFGIKFTGDIDAEGRLKYNFMFANGSSNRNELNKGKKFMGALSYYLTENFVIQGYGDWEDRPGNQDIYTTQAFMGYQSESFNAGALYAYQFRNNTDMAGDRHLDLVSIFLNTELSKKLKTFARVDHLFDRYIGGPGNDYIPMSDQAEPTFFTTGVDIELEENINLIPNIEAIVYGENSTGEQPETDLIPRITLFYSF